MRHGRAIAESDNTYPRVLNRHLVDEALNGIDAQTLRIILEN